MRSQDYYQKLNELLALGENLWQATIIETDGSTPARSGMKLLVSQASVFGNLGGGELEHLVIELIRQDKPEQPVFQTFQLSDQGDKVSTADAIPTGMICGGLVRVFWEPLFIDDPLYIVGAGHCGRALAHLARLCGYQARLIDNRPEVLDQIPDEVCADRQLSDFTDLDSLIRFGPQARIVIMTHGHAHDQHVLELCLGKPCGYLGMIGSSRKVAATLEDLRKKGFSEADLAIVHAPVGLPIGSQTPYEIAISILAELISIRSAQSRHEE